MQVGDIVRVKWHPTDEEERPMGVVTGMVQYGSVPSKFIKVALPNGYVATYRIETLEVICK